MKVVYELDKEDVRKIICEKYEVSDDKVLFPQIQDIFVRIDMTQTENPQISQEKAEAIFFGKAVPAEAEVEQAAADKNTVAELEKVIDDEDELIPYLSKLNLHKGMTDRDIPDDKLAEILRQGIKISEVGRALSLDKHAKDRLYWRATRLRSEGASFSDR